MIAMRWVAAEPAAALDLAEAAYARLTADFLMHPGIAHLKARLTQMLSQAV